MPDQPIAKKMWRYLTMQFGADREDAAVQLISKMPLDLRDDIRQNSHDRPLIQHKIEAWMQKKHLEVDIAVVQTATRLLTAQTDAYKALTKLKQARHEAQTADMELVRGAELGDLQHDVRRAELEAKKLKLEEQIHAQRELLRGRQDRTGAEALSLTKEQYVARMRTYAQLKTALDQQIAEDLDLFKMTPGVTADDVTSHQRELEDYRKALLADFAAGMARQPDSSKETDA